jgi:hypothetical protein
MPLKAAMPDEAAPIAAPSTVSRAGPKPRPIIVPLVVRLAGGTLD